MRDMNDIKRRFTIIQDESKGSNMQKLQEMRRFFDEENGMYKELKSRERMLNLIKLSSLILVLVGIYGLYGLMRQPYIADRGQIQLMIALTFGSGALTRLYATYCSIKLKKSGLIDPYNSSDMLLFCLLDDDAIKAVKVEHNRKDVRMIGNGFSIRLRVKGYRIVGEGEYATEINLDEKKIVLGNQSL